MAQITSGSTLICGKNQGGNRIYPVQFDSGTGGLQSLTVIHKEELRAYEIEFGVCKGLPNAPLAVDWLGQNGDGDPRFLAQAQTTINTVELDASKGVGDALVAVEIRFQDNSRELDLVSIEQSAPGVFVDPRLSFIGP